MSKLFLYSIALGAVMLIPGKAAQACNTEIFEFVDWSITPIDDQTNRITTTFRSNADKAVRMIDASAGYRDALGGRIASFALDRDISVEPGQTYSETHTWGPYTFERLLDLKHDEVETYICVRALLYDDGTIERFPEN